MEKRLTDILTKAYQACCERMQQMQFDIAGASAIDADRYSTAKAQEALLVKTLNEEAGKTIASAMSDFLNDRGIVDQKHYFDLVHGDFFLIVNDKTYTVDLKMGERASYPGSITAESLYHFSGAADPIFSKLCNVDHIYLCGFGRGSSDCIIIDAKELYSKVKGHHTAFRDSIHDSSFLDYSIFNARVKKTDFISYEFLKRNFELS